MMSLILFASCSSTKNGSSTQPSLFQKWELMALNGEKLQLKTEKPVYIEFRKEDSRIGGTAGCNTFFATYTLKDSDLSFSPIAGTKMYCGEEAMKIESDYLKALAAVTGYQFDKSELVLKNGNEEVARFKEGKSVPTELVGEWELSYITGRRIAFEGLYPDKKPSIRFKTIGMDVSANTSCNLLMATFQPENKQELFKLGATTLRACPGEGEMVFLDELKKINNYQVNGDTLTFFNGSVASMKFTKTNI